MLPKTVGDLRSCLELRHVPLFQYEWRFEVGAEELDSWTHLKESKSIFTKIARDTRNYSSCLKLRHVPVSAEVWAGPSMRRSCSAGFSRPAVWCLKQSSYNCDGGDSYNPQMDWKYCWFRTIVLKQSYSKLRGTGSLNMQKEDVVRWGCKAAKETGERRNYSNSKLYYFT